MKVGISSYTFPWAIGIAGYPQPATSLKPESLIDIGSDLGVRVVQIADNLPLDALAPGRLTALAAKARERGIEIEPGTRGTSASNLRHYLEIAEICGSHIIRSVPDVVLGRNDRDAEEEFLSTTEGELRSIIADLERRDVILCLENYEGISVKTLSKLIRRVDSPNIRVCLDSLNSLGRSEGYDTVLSELAPLTANLHVKDYRSRRRDHRLAFYIEGTAAGAGELPIRDMINRVQSGVSTIVELWTPWQGTLEETCRLEMEWARESVEFLHSIEPMGRPFR